MFISVVIIAFSLLLFLYWFRYSCLLILSTKTAKDYTTQVARANQLEFASIRAHLRYADGPETLDPLRQSLERDYRLLTGLLSHAAQFQLGSLSIEQRMLMIDYQVMRLTYRLSNLFSQSGYARQSLEEMADIVAHLANAMGERSAALARG